MSKLIYDGGYLNYDNNQATAEISATKKGLKVETFSMDWDTKDYIFYIEENENYNKNTKFNKDSVYFFIYQIMEERQMETGKFNIYRTIVK